MRERTCGEMGNCYQRAPAPSGPNMSTVRFFPIACLGLISALFLQAQIPTVSGCAVFPSNNIWNARVDSLPLDVNSDAYVQTLGATNKGHADFGFDPGNGIPYAVVPGSQPKFNVKFYYDGDAGPYPIPPNPPIEAGSDHHLLMIDKDNCILYELFNLQKQTDGSWLAGSGAIFPLNSDQLRASGYTSADAAGLPMFPGLVRYDEVLSGHINHALRFTGIPTGNRFIWPARHYASSYSGTKYPPMGQRFRLKQSVDISRYGPHMQVVLQALKTYGMILADNGASWFVTGVPDSRWNDDEMHQFTWLVGADFEAVDESSLMVNVNSAQAGVLPAGWVNIVSKNSGKCLDVTGMSTAERAPMQQWTCTGGENQKFRFTAVQNGYEITAENSGLQLDVLGGPSSIQNGTQIIQWPYWGGSNEIWQFQPAAGGFFSITALSSAKCMDVRGVSVDNGARIQQWTCLGSSNQQWKLVPVQ